MAERDDRFEDDRPFAARFQRAEEGAIDLDLVEGEAAQVDHRGVARAEIVQAHADAERAQVHDHGLGLLGVLDQHAFGQLQVEAVRVEAGRVEDRLHLGDEAALPELHRRHVDRDAQRRPAARVGAGPA